MTDEPHQEQESGRLLRSDRLLAITDVAVQSGSIRVAELAKMFGVTDVTIRRDLARLARTGILEREHGRAVAARGAESEFARRMQEQREAKQSIARRAASLVVDGATIVIDSGSTTAIFARELRGKQDLKVITNAITTAAEIVENPGATAIMTGGVIRRSTLGGVGDLAVATLRQLRVDQAFIATAGISEIGLTYPSLDEVSVKNAMIDAASEVILLADHTKFGKESLARIAPLSALDRIITSQQPDARLAAAIEEAGVELIVAPVVHELADRRSA